MHLNTSRIVCPPLLSILLVKFGPWMRTLKTRIFLVSGPHHLRDLFIRIDLPRRVIWSYVPWLRHAVLDFQIFYKNYPSFLGLLSSCQPTLNAGKYIYVQWVNGNFRLFAANGKRKRRTSVCLLQKETVNGSLFSLVANDK